jgi:hypothetical protein
MALNHIYETQFIMWVQLSQFLSPMRDFFFKTSIQDTFIQLRIRY